MKRRSFLYLVLSISPTSAFSAEFIDVVTETYPSRLRRNLSIEKACQDIIVFDLALSSAQIQDLREWSMPAANRMASVIGDQWHTAMHTLPSFIDEDVFFSNLRNVGSYTLTRTEVALLVG